jgi:hypothetical protein
VAWPNYDVVNYEAFNRIQFVDCKCEGSYAEDEV